MLSAQFKSLQDRGAQMRQSIFGTVTIVYDEKFTVPGYKSSSKKRLKTEQFGFLVPVDTVVRIPKACGFTPEPGKFLKAIWPDGTVEKLKLMDLAVHPTLGSEWALGCNAVL